MREKKGCCCCLVTKSIMSDSFDSVGYSPPASSVCGISQQEYWSRLPFPSPGDPPDPGIEPIADRTHFLHCRQILYHWATEEAYKEGESECRLVMSDSLQSHGLQPARLLCLWDFPARILEWAAISFSRGPSPPRDWISISCIGRPILYHWATGEARKISTFKHKKELKKSPIILAS